MKKFCFLFVILSLCLLLPSCATTRDLPPDMVITPSNVDDVAPDTKNQVQSGEYRKLIRAEKINNSGLQGAFWNNWVITSKGKIINLATKEVFSVCSDPLCEHRGDRCLKNVFLGSRSLLVSPNSTQGDLIIYVANTKSSISEDKTVSQNHRLLRCNYSTGEVSVLCENLPGPDFSLSIDSKTEVILFQQYLVNDVDEREYFLYLVNGKTGKVDILNINAPLSAKYVLDDMVYFGQSGGSMYCIDLSKKELTLEESATEIPENHSGYVYYTENPFEERVYVPDDIVPLCEKYGQETYQDFTGYDLYRINILQENPKPELVAQRVLKYGVNDDYVYYFEFDPQYVTSVLYTQHYDERGIKKIAMYSADDPDAPEADAMRNVFSGSYVPVHVLDTATLQEVAVIESEQYWIDSVQSKLMGDGMFVTWKGRAPEEYLTANSDIVRTKAFGYLYFNKPYLTFEDTVEFDLSESGF